MKPKKVENIVKNTFLKKCRGRIGDLNGGTKGPKKFISRWLRPKKNNLRMKIRNDGSIRN